MPNQQDTTLAELRELMKEVQENPEVGPGVAARLRKLREDISRLRMVPGGGAGVVHCAGHCISHCNAHPRGLETLTARTQPA